MSMNFSSPVNENQGFEADNDEIPPGFGDERGGHIPVNEDIASMESNDGGDDDAAGDRVSDRESLTSVKPIEQHTENHNEIEVHGPIRLNEDAKLHPEGFESGIPVDEGNHLHLNAGIDGLVLMNESERSHQIIKDRFISELKGFGVNTQVDHIHRNLFNANAITVAKLHTFLIYEKAVKNKNGGDANVKHVWFSASKDQINKIIAHGFSHDNIEKDGDFGCGLYFATDSSLIERLESSSVDDDGIRHILLCRVILGKVEVVAPGSKQCHPSSDEFQTGVDNLESPRKVIVWSTQLNTHILPEFVISFKILSGYNGPAIREVQFGLSHYPHMSIDTFLSGLSKILSPEDMKKITEYRQNYVERKISRHEMFSGFRNVAGNETLLMVAKDFKEKQQGRRGDESQGHLASGQVKPLVSG